MSQAWWRNAAIYQIYLRSFADHNGDGTGDLAGVRERLPYLRSLGVDALWFNPWFVSPMADGGYDVADYRDIDPLFGTLAEAEQLIGQAHAAGLRVILDLVPNHCSDAHPWFQAALAAAPGSVQRQRFWFLPGRGEKGELPPNNWQSYFGGPAWTRVPDGEWYLHMFASEQPDFNWEHQAVAAEFEAVLRFWLERGVDGFRIDVAHGLAKAAGLPDVTAQTPNTELPYQDCEAVHEIYRGWRKLIDSYDGDRFFVGEVWLPQPEQVSRYLRPDELHTVFNFEILCSAWEGPALRAVIEHTLAVNETTGAPPTWVLSNHDTVRHVTRYGRADTTFDMADKRLGEPTDLALGRRRARAAALLTLALPGGVYIYQGDELGLPEVEDIPDRLRQDPQFARTAGADPGRDGCRVPLPWHPGPTLGFSPAGARDPWLPQPSSWAPLAVSEQEQDPTSFLTLYRTALRLRREHLAGPAFSWLGAGSGTLAFQRGNGFQCWVNLGDVAAELPPSARILLSSSPLPDGLLPTDTCVWLKT